MNTCKRYFRTGIVLVDANDGGLGDVAVEAILGRRHHLFTPFRTSSIALVN